MSCYAIKLQLVPLCFHISNFQFKICVEMNWQRQPVCLATSCHWLQTNKMCCVLFIAFLRLSGRVWDAVAVTTMLPDVWTRPQCLYTYWATYGALIEHLWVNCSSVGHRAKSHNLQIYVQFAFLCLLFLEQYCIQIVYILCVYFFYGLCVVSVAHALLYISAWNTVVLSQRLKMRFFFVPWVYTLTLVASFAFGLSGLPYLPVWNLLFHHCCQEVYHWMVY